MSASSGNSGNGWPIRPYASCSPFISDRKKNLRSIKGTHRQGGARFRTSPLRLVPFYTPDKRHNGMPVPTGKAATLDQYFIIIGELQKIVENETGFWVFPSSHLAEAQVIEDRRIAPLFHRIKALREVKQVTRILLRPKGIQQDGIAGLITEAHRSAIENGPIAGIKSIAVRRYDIP